MSEMHEHTSIPRWTPEFDPASFDVAAVLREAQLQGKSAYKVLKALGYPVKKFISQEVPAFTAKADAEDGLIPVTASSTAIDLSGDDFAESAIDEMQASALGTTVFLNHSYILPEDVYGKISDCSVVRRQAFNPVTAATEKLTCWDLKIAPVGEEENPRAVRVTNMLQRSKLKLGVSVTVIVLQSTKRKDGGRTITHVFYIETSMVGIPCNQTAWADGEASKSAGDEFGHVVFSPLDMGDPSSVERFRQELTAWLQGEGKGTTVMDQNERNAGEGVTGAEGATATPTEKQAIERGLFKGLFQEEVDERTNTVSFLLSCLINALYDWRNQEKDEAALDELIAEFGVALKGAMLRDPDAEPYLVYYALSRVPFEQLSKAGARNSAADQQLLNNMHDTLVDCGVQCKKLGGADNGEGGDEGDVADKGVSPAAFAEATSKAVELETKNMTLQGEKTALETELKEAKEELERWEASGPLVLEALRQYSRQPLPRAGQASVSHVQ